MKVRAFLYVSLVWFLYAVGGAVALYGIGLAGDELIHMLSTEKSSRHPCGEHMLAGALFILITLFLLVFAIIIIKEPFINQYRKRVKLLQEIEDSKNKPRCGNCKCCSV